MKTAAVALFSAVVLLSATGFRYGTAIAEEVNGWWVEEGLGSSFDTSRSLPESLEPGSPVETGALPAAPKPGIWVEEGLGSSFDLLPGPGDRAHDP